MTLLYAESSAVLRWLLGSAGASEIQVALAQAQAVVSSAVTSVEVARVLRRLEAGDAIDRTARDGALQRYHEALAHWHVYGVTGDVIARAGGPFPVEPVRTLDALHLATALLFTNQVAPLAMLSADRRVSLNAAALGLPIATRPV